jgi:hypothetical protein
MITGGAFETLTGTVEGFREKKEGEKTIRHKAFVRLQGGAFAARVEIDVDSLSRL